MSYSSLSTKRSMESHDYLTAELFEDGDVEIEINGTDYSRDNIHYSERIVLSREQVVHLAGYLNEHLRNIK